MCIIVTPTVTAIALALRPVLPRTAIGIQPALPITANGLGITNLTTTINRIRHLVEAAEAIGLVDLLDAIQQAIKLPLLL